MKCPPFDAEPWAMQVGDHHVAVVLDGGEGDATLLHNAQARTLAEAILAVLPKEPGPERVRPVCFKCGLIKVAQRHHREILPRATAIGKKHAWHPGTHAARAHSPLCLNLVAHWA